MVELLLVEFALVRALTFTHFALLQNLGLQAQKFPLPAKLIHLQQLKCTLA
jgi:hypothetical protein